MIFTIKIDPFSFKKEGEKITYDDEFYFENQRFKSQFTYKNSLILKKPFEINESSKKSLNGCYYPNCLENTQAYQIYFSSHKKSAKIIDSFIAIKVDRCKIPQNMLER